MAPVSTPPLSEKKARETLEETRVPAEAEHWNGCVNSLYYACFYALSGLLQKDGLSSSKHTGLRSLFNRHYVKTGKVPKDLAKVYNDLFERRQEGDYLDFVSYQESQVSLWFAQAEKFLEHVITLAEGERK